MFCSKIYIYYPGANNGMDKLSINRTIGHYISNDDKHDLDIDDISRNLQITNSPANHMMNESEIDVSSLDGAGTLRRSVDNYHDFSMKQDELSERERYQTKTDVNHHSDEDNPNGHYQMHHDSGVSPVATPVPR